MPSPEDGKDATIERLLGDLNEILRREGRSDSSIVDRCPEPWKRELLSLMNAAALGYRALAPERAARQKAK